MRAQTVPSGIEIDAAAVPAPRPQEGHAMRLPSPHYRLIEAVLRDQTDIHGELLEENEWLLQPVEHEIRLRGNAFALESTLEGTGWVFLKLAPQPEVRGTQSEWDFCVRRGADLFLQQEDGYPWVTLPYEGGATGRIIALHNWQRSLRPYHPERDGLLLSNTWGDRSRDAHLSPEFMLREIDAAARLGVDIVQIDDGWERGVTANSHQSGGQGVWNGFWASDPNFWDENTERFPDGLAPLIAAAKARGIKFGLWFAPDSSDHAANWQRDVDAILGLHQRHGVDFFKIDGIKIDSATGEKNLKAFYTTALERSCHRITFDQDITAEERFGYFGSIEPGPLFVENRYTDWRRYWPHLTLRAAWQLTHWIDPLRLRLEWLNHLRHADQYAGDPLAPHCWQPDALFATVMFCSPLGWFETQNLPESYFEQAAPLIKRWKTHREAIARGQTLPIGSAPDGVAWTGFVSINNTGTGGHALIFRELNRASTWETRLPLLKSQDRIPCELLGGEGTATLQDGVLKVEIPQPLRFIWVRFEN